MQAKKNVTAGDICRLWDLNRMVMPQQTEMETLHVTCTELGISENQALQIISDYKVTNYNIEDEIEI